MPATLKRAGLLDSVFWLTGSLFCIYCIDPELEGQVREEDVSMFPVEQEKEAFCLIKGQHSFILQDFEGFCNHGQGKV